MLQGLSEYLLILCSNKIGVFLKFLENPNILSQLIIFKYILSWFALFDIAVNIIFYFILSYITVTRVFNKTDK